MTFLTSYPLRVLGDVSENHDSCRVPVKASDRRPGPYPYYGAQGIVDYVDDYLFEGEFVLVAEDGENLRSRKENIALMARGRFWVNNHAHILRGNGISDTRFLYYVINAVDISGYVTGSTIPKLSQRSLNSLMIPCPPLGEQRAIASLLGALDDKIDLNRRMNETLEAMARAIFKDWFVDFGPVRAKAEGRQPPGLSSEIAVLFPDALDDDDKPAGWEEKRVEDILELAYGKALKASDRINGPIPVYGSGGIAGYHNESLVEGPSIIVGRKGTVGTLYWEDNPFFPIDTVFYVKTKAPLTFCFYHLQTLGLDGMNTDAAVPGLNRNNVYRLPVVWAHEKVRSEFDKLVKPLRQKIRANTEESHILAQLRDLLLPKLMSGEIRLREAEKAVEAVA